MDGSGGGGTDPGDPLQLLALGSHHRLDTAEDGEQPRCPLWSNPRQPLEEVELGASLAPRSFPVPLHATRDEGAVLAGGEEHELCRLARVART